MQHQQAIISVQNYMKISRVVQYNLVCGTFSACLVYTAINILAVQPEALEMISQCRFEVGRSVQKSGVWRKKLT